MKKKKKMIRRAKLLIWYDYELRQEMHGEECVLTLEFEPTENEACHIINDFSRIMKSRRYRKSPQ